MRDKHFLIMAILMGVVIGVIAGLLLISSSPSPVRAQAINNGIPNYTLGLDPCGSTGITKSNVAVSVVTAATTQIVPISGSTIIYVCDWSFTIGSSTPVKAAVAFEYGGSTTCTSPTLLSGAMGNEYAGSGPGMMLVNGPSAGISFSTAAASGLCLVTTGTTVSLHGQVTYVQM
jgi:hypothetical protein